MMMKPTHHSTTPSRQGLIARLPYMGQQGVSSGQRIHQKGVCRAVPPGQITTASQAKALLVLVDHFSMLAMSAAMPQGNPQHGHISLYMADKCAR